MWCKICREHPNLADKNSAFYTGTNNFSHPAYDKHEKSKEHVNIIQARENRSLKSVNRIESYNLLKVLKKLTVDFSVFKEHSVFKERLS